MQLLDTASNAVSLEFEPYEFENVICRLSTFGRIVMHREATFDRLQVAGAELIYLDEWDAPCLISSDSVGSALLHKVVGLKDGGSTFPDDGWCDVYKAMMRRDTDRDRS